MISRKLHGTVGYALLSTQDMHLLRIFYLVLCMISCRSWYPNAVYSTQGVSP